MYLSDRSAADLLGRWSGGNRGTEMGSTVKGPCGMKSSSNSLVVPALCQEAATRPSCRALFFLQCSLWGANPHAHQVSCFLSGRVVPWSFVFLNSLPSWNKVGKSMAALRLQSLSKHYIMRGAVCSALYAWYQAFSLIEITLCRWYRWQITTLQISCQACTTAASHRY